jgi:nicotinamidase-related amidase
MAGQALIVVDMLNDFIDPTGALFCGVGAREIIPAVVRRLAWFRDAGRAVFFLQDAHAPDDREFARFPPHCIAGTWGSAIIPELEPRPGEVVIPKTRFSGFFHTGLEGLLQVAAPESVEVAGVCTSICVMDTVGGLADRDYAVIVHRNAVADFDAQMHSFALRRMQRIYGARIQ